GAAGSVQGDELALFNRERHVAQRQMPGGGGAERLADMGEPDHCVPTILINPLYFRKFLPEETVHECRVRLALRSLHHLSDQEAQGRLLAAPPVLYDLVWLGQDLG